MLIMSVYYSIYAEISFVGEEDSMMKVCLVVLLFNKSLTELYSLSFGELLNQGELLKMKIAFFQTSYDARLQNTGVSAELSRWNDCSAPLYANVKKIKTDVIARGSSASTFLYTSIDATEFE